MEFVCHKGKGSKSLGALTLAICYQGEFTSGSSEGQMMMVNFSLESMHWNRICMSQLWNV